MQQPNKQVGSSSLDDSEAISINSSDISIEVVDEPASTESKRKANIMNLVKATSDAASKDDAAVYSNIFRDTNLFKNAVNQPHKPSKPLNLAQKVVERSKTLEPSTNSKKLFKPPIDTHSHYIDFNAINDDRRTKKIIEKTRLRLEEKKLKLE